MESKVLLVLVALCCWCLVTQQVHASRLDDFRHQLNINREIEQETQRKRRPLSSLSRKPEQMDYHFASGIFRKRMFENGQRVIEDPGYYAFEDE